jgi:hypothetical protein
MEQKGEPMITSSDDKDFNPFDKSPQSGGVPLKTDTSRGKAALDKMRREKAEERNAELQKMKAVQDVDAMMLETGGEAAVIPEKVAQRMGKRMLPFVGVPLLGGMGAFVGFWYMATYRDMEFQPVLVAGTTIALLATGLIVRIRISKFERIRNLKGRKELFCIQQNVCGLWSSRSEKIYKRKKINGEKSPI